MVAESAGNASFLGIFINVNDTCVVACCVCVCHGARTHEAPCAPRSPPRPTLSSTARSPSPPSMLHCSPPPLWFSPFTTQLYTRCTDTMTDSSIAVSRPHSVAQRQHHIETLLLLFLHHLCASDAQPARSGYRAAHLQPIAQALYTLRVIAQAGTTAVALDVCTERDLFYRNPPLFGPQKQQAAHAAVERLCGWLNVVACHCAATAPHLEHQQRRQQQSLRPVLTQPELASLFRRSSGACAGLVRGASTGDAAAPVYTREAIGITAAGKSLLSGALCLELCSPPEVLDVAARGTAGVTLSHALVTRVVGCRPRNASGARGLALRLVVVEKESLYHALQQDLATAGAALRSCHALVCTKGYPCVAARHFLRRVHAQCPEMPVYVLVDGDPHGLCIALTAMGLLGSQGPSQPVAATPARAAALVPLRFVGVRPSLVLQHRATQQDCSSLKPSHACLSQGSPITDDDERVLCRVVAVLQAVLLEARGNSPAHLTAASTSELTTAAVVRHTLHGILAEARWMQRSHVKCELQLVCAAAGPLTFLEKHVERVDAELRRIGPPS